MTSGGPYCLPCSAALCQECIEGKCEDWCVDPANCKSCDGEGNCIVCNDDPTKICCDGMCKPKCEEEIDEPRCKSEWNEDCIACVGIFEFCSNHNTRIFTDSVTYTCNGGCDGDCAEVVSQPVCSEVYKCKAGENLFAHVCTDQLDTPVPLDCHLQTDIPWDCSRCTTDYDELESVHYPPYPSKKCQ